MLLSRHKARPNLRGAAAPTFADGAEIRWLRLSPDKDGFEILDDQGARLVRRGRLVTFLPLMAFRTSRQQRVARRAHRRAVRAAIDRGTLDVALMLPGDTVRVRRFGAAAALFLFALIVWLILRNLGPIFTGAGTYGWPAWLALGGMLTVAILKPAAYYALFHRFTDQNVRRVRFTTDGLEAEFMDGRTTRQRWTDLRSMKDRRRLRFADGTDIRILPRGLAGAILAEFERRLDPDADSRERRRSYSMAVRIFIYFQLGGIAAAALARAGIGPPGRSPLVAYLFVGLLFPLALTVSALAQVYFQPGARASPRPRRSRSRLAARTRIART